MSICPETTKFTYQFVGLHTATVLSCDHAAPCCDHAVLWVQGDLIDYPYLIDAEPTPASYLLLCTEDYLRVYSTGALEGRGAPDFA